MSSYIHVFDGLPKLLEALKQREVDETCRYEASQDLVYQGQIARGLFVVIRGILYLKSWNDGATLASSVETGASAGILVPTLAQLDFAKPATVATASSSRILFISRTRLLAAPSLADIFATTTQPLLDPVMEF